MSQAQLKPTIEFPIQFIDLSAQRRKMGKAVDEAILKVVNHGGYIMGPEVAELEKQLCAFTGAKHCISCSNGTDSLVMLLMALGVKQGDAVLVPSFTFAATAEAVALVEATPVFADVNCDDFNLNSDSLGAAYKVAKEKGLNPRGVMSVDLFGQTADYAAIESFCRETGMWLMSDAAQSFGATYQGRNVGTIGIATSTSFFPAKPLGCYGDGGACFTDDAELAATLQSLRVHGKGTHKYDNARIGLNARLDTMQAAVLLEKLKLFPQELKDRQAVADRYNAALSDIVATPQLLSGRTSSWAQYTLIIENKDRDQVAEMLKQHQVPTTVYYPKPLHQQTAYATYPQAPSLVNSESLAKKVLSLPMHPYLDTATQDYIIDAVRNVLK
jgi:dTDP-4-amino-4,6-dideoxygalactose transaminase